MTASIAAADTGARFEETAAKQTADWLTVHP